MQMNDQIVTRIILSAYAVNYSLIEANSNLYGPLIQVFSPALLRSYQRRYYIVEKVRA
jgi:hypothetical protein